MKEKWPAILSWVAFTLCIAACSRSPSEETAPQEILGSFSNSAPESPDSSGSNSSESSSVAIPRGSYWIGRYADQSVGYFPLVRPDNADEPLRSIPTAADYCDSHDAHLASIRELVQILNPSGIVSRGSPVGRYIGSTYGRNDEGFHYDSTGFVSPEGDLGGPIAIWSSTIVRRDRYDYVDFIFNTTNGNIEEIHTSTGQVYGIYIRVICLHGRRPPLNFFPDE